MKIENNKGFAITTVIYGLAILGILTVAIMMATMSTNRTNSKELSKSIEEELNLIKGSERSFEYDNGGNDNTNIPQSQEYIVPEGQSGFYKIELWGTQGGGPTGGLGAYTSGIIKLNEGERLYFYVGRHVALKGGRATEVRVVSGEYSDPNSYLTRIMVAAGGGLDADASGGTLCGYNSNMNSLGGAINLTDFSINTNSITNGSLMGFPRNYAKSSLTQYSVPDRNNVPTYNGDGGDGYYASNNISMGGTSYISGYGGCETIGMQGLRYRNIANHEKYAPTFFYQKTTYNQDTDETTYTAIDNETTTRRYVFLDGRMYPGVNYGDGKAKISLVATTDDLNKLRKNKDFNGVKEITDCVSKETGAIQSIRIAALSNGIDYGTIKNVTSSGNQYCVTISIDGGRAKNIDEIDVWHYTTKENVAIQNRIGIDGKNVINHLLAVKNNSGTPKIVEPVGTAETETVTGLRYSAYQPKYTQAIPNGVYYIIPVLSENNVLSAKNKSEEDSNAIGMEPYLGYKRQKWSIESIGSNEYKIIEQARYKALSIKEDENIVLNTVFAGKYFNNFKRDDAQVWKILPVKDGTYIIETIVSDNIEDGKNSGYLAINSNSETTERQNESLIGLNNQDTLRYKLVSANYYDKSS